MRVALTKRKAAGGPEPTREGVEYVAELYRGEVTLGELRPGSSPDLWALPEREPTRDRAGAAGGFHELAGDVSRSIDRLVGVLRRRSQRERPSLN